MLQPNFLRNHDEVVQPGHHISAEMRKLTVGWMGEVVREYGLCQETLFLACGLFDRFLSCSKVRHAWLSGNRHAQAPASPWDPSCARCLKAA